MPFPRAVNGNDIRHALRRWWHRPAFALTAIVTLALGIGATTAIFSVVDAVLLQAPPWPDADRVVAVHAVFPQRRLNPGSELTWNRGLVSYPAWDALRSSDVFDDVAAWRRNPFDTTFGEARVDLVQTMHVSSNLLPVLGASDAARDAGFALGRMSALQDARIDELDDRAVTEIGRLQAPKAAGWLGNQRR